ncbi:polysaccharide deacetylase family protein [Pradoshia sp.]
MKRKSIVFLCLLVLCLPGGAMAERKIPILMYHSIAEYEGKGDPDLYVSPKDFESQILYLREHGFTPLTFEEWDERENVKKPIFLTFDDGYKNNLNAYDIFKKLKTADFKPKGTFFVISEFIGRPTRLSKSDLKMLAESGLVSVQSHTAAHPELTKIDNLDSELKGSKEAIEEMTNKPVIALAYPYGEFNQKVIDETKKVYDFGIATALNDSGGKDARYKLSRIFVTGSMTLDEFARKVEGKGRKASE